MRLWQSVPVPVGVVFESLATDVGEEGLRNAQEAGDTCME